MASVDTQEYKLEEIGPIVVSEGFRSYVLLPHPDTLEPPELPG